MHCKLNNDPLMRIHNILKNNIFELYVHSKNDDPCKGKDKTLESILKLNDAKGDFNFKQYSITKEFNLVLVFNTDPSSEDMYLDYINVYGSGQLIVFMNYFKNMKTVHINKPVEEMTIDEKASYEIGNSNEFAALINIMRAVIKVLGLDRIPSGSIQSKINTMVPIYTAASIVNSIRPLCENDIEGCMFNLDTIQDMLGKYKEVFLGVYK